MNKPSGQCLTAISTYYPITLEEVLDPLGKWLRFLTKISQDRLWKLVVEGLKIRDSDFHFHADPVLFDEDLRDGGRCHSFGHNHGVAKCVRWPYGDAHEANQSNFYRKSFHIL